MKLETTFILILICVLDETVGQDNGNLTIFKEHEKGNEEAANLLSRRKRYIVFPKGSSLQLLLELLVHVPTQFHVAIGPTLQVAWPLNSEISEPSRRKRSSLVENSNLKRHVTNFKKFFNLKNISTGEALPGKKYKIFGDLATLLYLFGMTVGLAWQLPDDPMIYSEFKKKHKMYRRSVFKKMGAFMQPSGINGRQCVLKALCESGQRTPSKKGFLKEILHKIFSVDEEEPEENEEDKLYRKAHRSANQNCETLYPECRTEKTGMEGKKAVTDRQKRICSASLIYAPSVLLIVITYMYLSLLRLEAMKS